MKATQTNKYIVVGIAVSAMFAFIGGFFVNVNKEVPMNTKPLKATHYQIPPSEAHKYQPKFNVSFGSVAHADAMTAREQILNYPWDEVYTRENYDKKRFQKPCNTYRFKNIKSFVSYFSNPSHIQKIEQDPIFFSSFFDIVNDGSKINGEISKIGYRIEERIIYFTIKYTNSSQGVILMKKLSNSAHQHLTSLIGSQLQ